MKNETYNLISAIAQSLGLVVSIAVGLVVLWYTRETQKLRKSTESQLRLLQIQTTLQTRPFAQAAFLGFDIDNSTGSPEQGISVTLENPVAAAAFYITVVVRLEGAYHVASQTIASIAEKGTFTKVLPFREVLTASDLRLMLAPEYPDLPEALFLALLAEGPYIATIALDSYANHYLVVRQIHLSSDGEEILNFHARMLYPESPNQPRN